MAGRPPAVTDACGLRTLDGPTSFDNRLRAPNTGNRSAAQWLVPSECIASISDVRAGGAVSEPGIASLALQEFLFEDADELLGTLELLWVCPFPTANVGLREGIPRVWERQGNDDFE